MHGAPLPLLNQEQVPVSRPSSLPVHGYMWECPSVLVLQELHNRQTWWCWLCPWILLNLVLWKRPTNRLQRFEPFCIGKPGVLYKRSDLENLAKMKNSQTSTITNCIPIGSTSPSASQSECDAKFNPSIAKGSSESRRMAVKYSWFPLHTREMFCN